MGDDSRKRGYWRQVGKKAWELSKEHFAWTYPIFTGLAVFLIGIRFRGWDKAVEDLGQTLVASGVAAVIAVVIYCINVARAGSGIYGEQLRSIERIERERDDAKVEVSRLTSPLTNRRRIGDRLMALHQAGVGLDREIVESDDETSFDYWAEKVRLYRVEVIQFLTEEVSPAKAAYFDAVPSSFPAIDRIGLRSARTAAAKTGLLQRLEHRLSKLVELMRKY
jgi:hypothetical protein